MIDPTMGAYFKSGNTPLSVLEIIDCYKNGTPPEAVFFAEEKRADEMLESSTGIYTNAFTFLFDGESTEKGIRHLLFRERKIPVYVQYVEEQSKNFYLRRNVLWASEIISVLFILSMIVFFIHVLKTYPPPGGWF